MSFIASIIYGFVSGITEVLPVSSQGHQALMRYLFGAETGIPLQEFLVHIGVLIALIVGCAEVLSVLRRERKMFSSRHRRKDRYTDRKSYYDFRLLRSASILLFVALFTYFATKKFENSLLSVMSFWLVNAFVLLIVDHMPRGNRDARTMSTLDSFVMGIVAALSVLPGVSRTGMISGYAITRGVDDETSTNWALLLGIPALVFYIFFDVVCFMSTGLGIQTMGAAIGCVFSGVAAFAGGYLGVSLLKLILNHTGLSKFAYYSIGAAMFSFAIFLIT